MKVFLKSIAAGMPARAIALITGLAGRDEGRQP
jgi:hypothetical protein